ncbi:MAG: class I tRNA ligase family protein, partial [Porphyromonadaceae bacterium]|nr:class I tRNA ligase family protein [Porphyromonadaceae bacterium]
RIEKHTHNYPHCWRTDKPVLYYPLDSWFIRTTAVKDRMIELNKTIKWKPESTGTGRFGKWLENLQDWNLSRSRFWGTPLPIWRSEDGKEEICIGSVEELLSEIDKAVEAGLMEKNPYKDFVVGDNSAENYDKIDLHRPYVDNIVLLSPSGQPMHREADLIDVWFDSGAMPFAQQHYPFEHKEDIENGKLMPADFIAEGVDQTRGWFFTLHAIATMIGNTVAFKNVVSNGLVLDKNGNKMSKRLGNAVDPFSTIEQYGSDPLRWYMITNSSPWDNLKFDVDGIDEVKRKFFGTLHNTYQFFALYANLDHFTATEPLVEIAERAEIDRWILSSLNTLIEEVDTQLEDYEPTKAARAISDFVIEQLSNWYVRLSRRRFWAGEMTKDKLAAYQTLYQCLLTISKLMAPVSPFYADRLYCDLVNGLDGAKDSVHLERFPKVDQSCFDKKLERSMSIAQQITSMVLSLRRKVNIKVRQPLMTLMIPLNDIQKKRTIEHIEELIKAEVNVKEIKYVDDNSGVLVKRIKPDFKKLGPKYGKIMKLLAEAIKNMSQDEIRLLEKEGSFDIEYKSGEPKVSVLLEDVEIASEDIPGWLVANEDTLTVALDVTVTEELRKEGLAREFVNRIQNLRKQSGFELNDKINLLVLSSDEMDEVIKEYHDYISKEVQAEKLELHDAVSDSSVLEFDDFTINVQIEKL